jgi:hypothetical protein
MRPGHPKLQIGVKKQSRFRDSIADKFTANLVHLLRQARAENQAAASTMTFRKAPRLF